MRQKMSNKAAGTRFENAFAEELAAHWFWVHLFQDNKNGQPCDVIACRNGNAYLIDCKDCQTKFFVLSRMEENQLNAMKLFQMTGNGIGLFAIRFQDGAIYLVSYDRLEELKAAGFGRIDATVCRTQGMSLLEWLAERNEEDGWGENNADCDWQRDKSEKCTKGFA